MKSATAFLLILLTVTVAKALHTPTLELVAAMTMMSVLVGFMFLLQTKKIDEKAELLSEMKALEHRLTDVIKEQRKIIDGLTIAKGFGR